MLVKPCAWSIDARHWSVERHSITSARNSCSSFIMGAVDEIADFVTLDAVR